MRRPETRNERRESVSRAQAMQVDSALVIFAKAPIPGQVKTRLCPPLTADEAATLHGSFVLDQLERTKAAIAKFRLPAVRVLACAPSSTHVFFKILGERQGVRLLDQVGAELGARMHASFMRLFADGFRRVVLVGTDVPSLPLTHYRQAFDLLETHDLVLGPARDGGYYLIGLTQPVADLFHDIPWSTDHVLATTRERAAGRALKTALLPTWRDVDTLDDLRAVIRDSAAESHRPQAERTFSMRTAGALSLIGKRLLARS